MPYLEWTDDLSVNVKEIDTQHKKLVKMVNTLHEAFIANKANNVHKEIIDGMVEYARVHFATEEKYMLKFNFPGYEQHKEEHNTFVQKAVELQNQFKKAGFVFSNDILDFLRKWLKNHILGTDKKYSNFFNENDLF